MEEKWEEDRRKKGWRKRRKILSKLEEKDLYKRKREASRQKKNDKKVEEAKLKKGGRNVKAKYQYIRRRKERRERKEEKVKDYERTTGK